MYALVTLLKHSNKMVKFAIQSFIWKCRSLGWIFFVYIYCTPLSSVLNNSSRWKERHWDKRYALRAKVICATRYTLCAMRYKSIRLFSITTFPSRFLKVGLVVLFFNCRVLPCIWTETFGNQNYIIRLLFNVTEQGFSLTNIIDSKSLVLSHHISIQVQQC